MGARVLIAISVLAAICACKKQSSIYCEHNPDVCHPPDAAMMMTCGADTDCPMDRPHCDLDTSTCVVQCTTDQQCMAPLPYCDTTRNHCVECTDNSQCASNACLFNGTCQAVNNTLYVDAQNGNDANPCSQTLPCQTLEAALALTNPAFPNIKLIGAFTDGVKVTIASDVTIFADPPLSASYTLSVKGDVFTINPMLSVTISGLDISCNSAGGTGIKAPMPTTIALSQVAVHDCAMGGIVVMGGSLTLSRSEVYSNGSTGITMMGAAAAAFDMTNNFIHHNGAAGGPVGGVILGVASTTLTQRFEFNTVVANIAKTSAGGIGGVSCPTGSTSGVPDNIIAGNTGNTASKNAVATCSAGSITDDISSFSSFNFKNSTGPTFDYHLTAGSIALDGAAADASVTVDYDGEARPNGGYDYGADELH